MKLIDIYSIPYREEMLYQLLKERDNTSNISHSRLPGMREHVEFVNSKPYSWWCFIITDGSPAHGIVGAAYMTPNNEVGIQILKQYRRRGYGFAALQWILKEAAPNSPIPSIRPGELLFNVKPGNKAGIGLLQKAGLKLRQITYEAAVSSGDKS